MNEKIVTIAALLKNEGYTTGQFGKNHLGDLNHMLPTNHGFDEFYGNLYHLNAEEEPEMYDYFPKEEFGDFIETVKPRGVIHSFATDVDDKTEQPRWGKVGKQKIEDTGPLNRERMLTCDDDFADKAKGFIKKAVDADKPFFVWVNFTHMHLFTHTKKESLGQAGRWQSPYHDTMIDHDKNVGTLLDYLDELGIAENTLRHVLDRQRPASQLMARRRHDPVPQREEHQLGRRVPDSAASCATPARSSAGSISNEIVQHHDWLPTFLELAGNKTVVEDLKKGVKAIGRTYKNHIDGVQPGGLPDRQGGQVAAEDVRVHLGRRRHAGSSLRQLEDRVHGAALQGHDGGVGGAVHAAASREAVQSADRPVRVRRRHVELATTTGSCITTSSFTGRLRS